MVAEKTQEITQIKRVLESDLEGLPIRVNATPMYAFLEIPRKYVKHLVYDAGAMVIRLRTDDGDVIDIEISRDYGVSVMPVSINPRIKTVYRDSRVRPSMNMIEYNEFMFRIVFMP